MLVNDVNLDEFVHRASERKSKFVYLQSSLKACIGEYVLEKADPSVVEKVLQDLKTKMKESKMDNGSPDYRLVTNQLLQENAIAKSHVVRDRKRHCAHNSDTDSCFIHLEVLSSHQVDRRN